MPANAPLPDIETFTWVNLPWADIGTDSHGSALELFQRDVVEPAFKVLSDKLLELSASESDLAAFELLDYEPLYCATIEALTLAIQSMWERQLRAYLVACARCLDKEPAYTARLHAADWARLQEHFAELRGIELRAFPSFADLDLLQLLGNACRHGDGRSAKALFDRHPWLWPSWPPDPTLHEAAEPPAADARPSFQDVAIASELPGQMVLAIVWFWEDQRYIYTNSISQKHTTAVRHLAEARQRRQARQRVWTPPGSRPSSHGAAVPDPNAPRFDR
jgi:hypothetical protein